MNQTKTWTLNADAIGPNVDAQISQRTISEEPMVRSAACSVSPTLVLMPYPPQSINLVRPTLTFVSPFC